jgi:hypothetical protein
LQKKWFEVDNAEGNMVISYDVIGLPPVTEIC